METKDLPLYRAFLDDRRKAEGESHLVRDSSGINDETGERQGMYPLCGRGDVNTYSLFAELNRNLIRLTGRVGCIVPSGIATDDTTKLFFQDLMCKDSLFSLFDFENRDAIFQSVHRSYKFTLLTMAGGLRKAEQCAFVFFAHSVDDLSDVNKQITMSFKDIVVFNPISKTCPVLRTSKDFTLLKALHEKGCLLESTHWGGFYIRLIHLDDHKESVSLESDLTEGSFNKFYDFVTPKGVFRRVHEPKLLHLFDHRYATFASTTEADLKQGQTTLVSEREHSDVDFTFKPRYWVKEGLFRAIIEKYPAQNGWLIGYRDIARSTDVRTCIACAIPETPATVSMPCLGVGPGRQKALLLANLASFCLDYAVRLKVPGTHLTYGIVKQLPLLPPITYHIVCPWHPQETLDKWIVSRVVELTFTAWDIKPFAEDIGYMGDPFVWNEERRFHLRCELDAAYFHLYGISEADAEYIMETFPIVKAKDITAHGTYRTKDTILRLYREFARPVLTPAQIDMLKAMAYVAAFVQAWKKRVETGILEAGLVLMVNDTLRKAYLTNTPVASRQSGRHHAKLLDWMPLAVSQMLSKDSIKIDPKSPEGLPFYLVGPSPFDLTNLGDYVKKAEEAVKVIKKIGEQKARTEVEECIDDPSNLVPV